MKQRPAVFFDRDGVLNVDKGYAYQPEQIEWIQGAPEAIRYFNEQGCLVFVVTNQSGVARGYYNEEDVRKLHAWMNRELAKQGARIDAFYHCPHHPEGSLAEFRQECDCRKPKPGMLVTALAEWPVDKTASFLVGDKPSDVEAARAAGLTGYLFTGGNLYEFLQKEGLVGA